MKLKTHKSDNESKSLIKVRLDNKTFISLSRSSLKIWLKKYPEAKVM
jgi:hypothetical protein